ncbi:MAG: M48 family metallopeptidase [Bdellovibrionota bacterium]
MLYAFFLIIAIVYNWRKFRRERTSFLSSLVNATDSKHREMILSHHFYIFVFEAFLSFVVAHFISERAFAIGLIELGMVYLVLLFAGFWLYQFFIRYVEKQTNLSLLESFQRQLIQEVRVNFAIILLPIFIYSVINMTFQDGVYEEWGSLWFIGLVFNIIFVSVLTITCSVIIMLRLIPNREITEPEYLEIINKRLADIGIPDLRVRWIETDIKNAFVVGLKLLRFSNQTMFIGRRLRTTLTLAEFDAVIAHELAHVANRHVHKRMIDLVKNLLSVLLGVGLIMILLIAISLLYWGEDASFHAGMTASFVFMSCFAWVIFNYALLFDTIRSHEYEADAFAVMELKADFEAMKSALKKLSTPEEMPDYLKGKLKPQQKKNFFQRHFSTHPDLDSRIDLLERKLAFGLPFNHYVSPAKKLRGRIGSLMTWKVLVPGFTAFLIFTGYSVNGYREAHKALSFIQKSSKEQIVKREIASLINSRPTPLSPSLMYYIVKKQDEALIDHFLAKGADKGRTLIYVSQTKNLNLLRKYYALLKDQISDEEYFMVLKKTAEMNDTDGYRYLVNADKFEGLDSVSKQNIARIHSKAIRSRAPASLNKKK